MLNCHVLIEKLFYEKHLLVENQLKESETFDSIYFRGKSHFEGDGTQNFLVFQPVHKYFEIAFTTNIILSRKSKGFSDETIKPPKPHTVLSPELSYLGNKTKVQFNESCLTQNKIIFYHKKVVNTYIVYELNLHNSNSNYPTLENCLFGAVKLTRGTEIDNYKHFGYGIGFNRKEFLSIRDEVGRNVIIFGVDTSSSLHIDNKEKDILILGKVPTQGLGEYSLTAEKIYSINFFVTRKKCCLSLHYNRANSYLLVNGTEIIKFKAKDSEIVANPLRLQNIMKEFSEDNTKRTGLNGYVDNFGVDYDTIAVADILDIHKYLMKKTEIV